MDKLQLLLDVTLNKQSGQKELQKLQKELQKETLTLNIGLNPSNLDKAIKQISNINLESEQAFASASASVEIVQQQLDFSPDKSNIVNQIGIWLEQKKENMSTFSGQLTVILNQLNTISEVRFDELRRQIAIIQKSTEDAGFSSQNFFDDMIDSTEKFTQWLSAVDSVGIFDVSRLETTLKPYDLINQDSFNSLIENCKTAGFDINNLTEIQKNLDKATLSYLETVQDGNYAYESYIAHVKNLNSELGLSAAKFNLVKVGAAMLNAVLVTGVSMALNFAIKKFQEYQNAQKTAIKAGQEVLDKYKQLISEFEAAKNTINQSKDTYLELADGVNGLGENISLTTEEYKEYLNIANKIAKVSPELIIGFDQEGNAILNLKGNIDALTESYRKKEKAAHAAIIADSSNILKMSDATLNGSDQLIDKVDTYQTVSDLMKSQDDLKTFINKHKVSQDILYNEMGYLNPDKQKELNLFSDLLKDIGTSIHLTSDEILAYLIENQNKVHSQLSILEPQMYSAINANRSIVDSFLRYDDRYVELDDYAQKFAYRLVNGLSNKILSEANEHDLSNIANTILNQLGDTDLVKILENLYNIDDSDFTLGIADHYTELINQISNAFSDIEGFDGNGLKIALGLTVADDYYDSLQKAKEMFGFGTYIENEAEYLRLSELWDTIETLSQKELNNFISIAFDGEKTKENLELLLADVHQAMAPKNIEQYDFNFISNSKESVNNLLSDISTIQSAITTLTSGSYSSSELLTSMQSFSSLLEGLKDKEGIDVSTISSASDLSDAFKELSGKYLSELLDQLDVDPDSEFGQMLANIVHQAIEVDGALDGMNIGIDAIQNSYNILTSAMEEYNESGYVSLDTLQNLLSLDGEYMDCLIDENGQLQLNSDTYAQMVSLRLDEAEAIAVRKAIGELEELQTRKEEAATRDYAASVETLQTKLEGLAGSYDVVTDAAIKSGVAQDFSNAVEAGSALDEAETKRIIDNLNATLTLIKGTRTNIDSSLGFVMNGKSGSSSSSSSSASSAKAFSDEINWAEQSIKNLNNALSSLQAKLNDVHLSYEDQAKILTEVSDKQKTLADAYTSTAALYETEWNRLKALIPEEYVIKITTDNDFSMTAFTDENLFKSVKAASDAYDTYIDALDKSASANHSYADSLINLYNAQQTHLSNEITLLSNAQESIQNAINISETLDRLNTEKQYRQLIAYSKQQQELYIQKLNTAKAQLETISDKTSDRYYEVRNEIQQCESAISSCVQEQLKWTQTIMELPVQQLQRVNQELQNSLSTLQKQQSQYDQAMKGVIAALDEEISKIEEARKAEADYYNQLITDKQEELNTLQETNNERRIQLELEKAQYAFEQAKKQKSIRILRNGEFIYEADQSAIKDARDSLDTALYNKQVDELNNSIADLQNQLDAISDVYQEQIDELNLIKEAWNDVAASVERLHNMKLADSLFGNDWRELLLAGDDRDLNYVTMLYGTNAENQKALEQQIEINNELIQQIEDYVAAWKAGEISISEALEGISETVEDTDGEILAAKRRIQSTDEYAANWDEANLQIQTALADLNLAEMESADTEKTIFDQRILDMNDFAAQYANICQIIAHAAKSMIIGLDEAVTAAESAVAKLERLAAKAEAARNTINDAKSSSHSGVTPNGSGAIPKYHTGIENGLIASGSARTTEEKALHYLATNKLAKNEVPVIAMKGEAVFTPNQVDTFLSNFSTASQQVNVIPQFVHDFNPHDVSQVEQNTEINVQFGDLSFPHVTTVEDFARDMEAKFPLILRQVAARKH